jgi:hypothetical protein
VKVNTPVEEFTEQPVNPAFVTEYVIAPSPLDDANTLGVSVPAVTTANVFGGAHDTVWMFRTVMVQSLESPFWATTAIVTGLE